MDHYINRLSLAQYLIKILKFVLSIAVAGLITSASAFANSAANIETDKSSVDFGDILEGQTASQALWIKNSGSAVLVINNVQPSCSCVEAIASSYEIPPDKKSSLEIRYVSAGKNSGKDEKNILIFTNDPKRPVISIDILANVVYKIPLIGSDELFTRLNNKEKIIILDVREENEYRYRHIPGAVWFAKSRFDRSDKKLEALLKGYNKKDAIVAYCGAGHRSSYVTRKLRQAGYNVFNLDGISAWEKKGYPLVWGPKPPAGTEPSIIMLEEAYEHYFKLFRDVVWIDVRAKDVYAKGHIRGALSCPLSELELVFADLPIDKEIVVYCEGVTAKGTCEASISAARILIAKGFKPGNIKVFEDGFSAWENAGYPID